MKTYYVSRKNWYRGKGDGQSKLRKRNGQMCCLGFVSEQCGAKALTNKVSPEDVRDEDKPKLPQWLFHKSWDSEECTRAMEINDCDEIGDEEREKKLRELFRRNGDRIVFRP